ncbi:hypothetical protein KZZ52_05290 [Dactylosporangium sp. AC04546]|uniref:hypothetical protein n=1 Tax=Dactylosporangium sp. AC04546 TaxID=2862460 RepID=UPI001EDF3D0B|nr:hypothetical protein [Dactylosporangium sp. AC04546]WVK84827.1 hypothetical protein KZZ52_05290 [Dactylosporangium sp. AC04546]
MKERWLPVGLIAGALFLVNVIARLVVRFGAGSDDDKQVTIGLWALFAVGAVMIPVAFWYARRHPMIRVVGDLGIAVVVACLLAVLVGPFVSGVSPFSSGVGLVFRQFFYFVGLSAIGAVLGMLALMTMGMDYKSQSWKRYIERTGAKPRRIVKR